MVSPVCRTVLAGFLVAAIVGLLSLPEACADIFRLSQGGQVEGEWLNKDEQPVTRYLVRTSGGVTMVLSLSQVQEAIRQTPAEKEYAGRAAAAADSAAAQWALAEWCRQSGLTQQRANHLQRTIELDGSHRQARAALGYQYVHGEWITRDDMYRRQGYEFYRGKWRTPQEIEILESRGRQDVAEKDWLAKLRRWRQDLDSERAKGAYESLAAIRDPVAVRPLAEFFARERVRRVKMVYADVLAQINSSDAIAVLAERTLADPDEEIFFYCIEKLVALAPPRVGEAFIAALKDFSNIRVNRAAVALARLQDTSAISPLIEALITTHTQVVSNGTPRGGTGMSYAFGKDGTFAKQGGDGPLVAIVHVQNQPVLDALTKLTGASFGFDQKAWRYWHAQDKIAREAVQPVGDVRRN
jgi:hypothetical protein